MKQTIIALTVLTFLMIAHVPITEAGWGKSRRSSWGSRRRSSWSRSKRKATPKKAYKAKKVKKAKPRRRVVTRTHYKTLPSRSSGSDFLTGALVGMTAYYIFFDRGGNAVDYSYCEIHPEECTATKKPEEKSEFGEPEKY